MIADLRWAAAGELPEAAHRATAGALALVRAWLQEEQFAASRLVVLSDSAVAAGPGEEPSLAAAPIWGLLRSAHSEHPDRVASIDTDGTAASLSALPGALALLGSEPELALREGEVLAPRLARAPKPEIEAKLGFDPEATTLVAGGGALGALVARHLVSAHGARHILVVSRRGEDAEAAVELREELERAGCR